jgi:hypothetical protein
MRRGNHRQEYREKRWDTALPPKNWTLDLGSERKKR